MRVNYGISSSFKLKEWDLNPSSTEEETKSLLQPPSSPHLVFGIGRCWPWDEGRREPKRWVIYLPGSCLVLSLSSYPFIVLEWTMSILLEGVVLVSDFKTRDKSGVLKMSLKNVSWDWRKCVGYAGTLCYLCNFFIILKQLKLGLIKYNK